MAAIRGSMKEGRGKKKSNKRGKGEEEKRSLARPCRLFSPNAYKKEKEKEKKGRR